MKGKVKRGRSADSDTRSRVTSSKKDGSHYRLIVQPDDGVAPVVELINAATHSLLIKQFTVTDPAVMAALVGAHKRGVSARVMLNPHRSSGDRANDESYAALRQAGLQVEWSNPAFAVTHEKSLVVDGVQALIATFNMATKYFTETRDYGIVTTEPRQVAEVIACFQADWKREPFHADPQANLLWSNNNSRQIMALFIDTAERELVVQHPKFVDATIVERISAARKRGVKVRVLCGGKHGISEWDILDTFSSLRVLDRFGVKVRRQKHLKLHAKLIIADGKRAQIGSMNIDRSAFDLRRELGIVLHHDHVIKALSKVFEHDWRQAKPYAAPDPLRPETHGEGELPHDPHFVHE